MDESILRILHFSSTVGMLCLLGSLSEGKWSVLTRRFDSIGRQIERALWRLWIYF